MRKHGNGEKKAKVERNRRGFPGGGGLSPLKMAWEGEHFCVENKKGVGNVREDWFDTFSLFILLHHSTFHIEGWNHISYCVKTCS